MANSLYWHDYETWGEVPARDRPSQFAGVRTDEQLNIIGEPLMIYCQPTDDFLPKPEACLVTGLSPQKALAEGLPEPEFVATLLAELGAPGTCGVGYNSIRFDDEVTRYALYRNLHDPYEREWRNGNSRWDIIDMLRMTRALRPEGIEWPNYEDGRPCFKLEMLTRANNLNHESAHDALSDVYATIAVARLVRSRQPKLYDYAYKLRDKRFVGSLIDLDGLKPLLHISSRFPSENGNAALVVPLAYHPSNKNSVIAFNLAADPRDLLDLPVEEMRRRLYTRSEDLAEGETRLALKEVHLNKSPMLLPVAMLDAATGERLGLDRASAESHWQLLHNLSSAERQRLRERLHQLYSESAFAESSDPEQQLYAGFFDDQDKRLLIQARSLSPEALAREAFKFRDPRLPELLFRYRARHFPQTLSAEEKSRWEAFRRQRLTDPAAGAGIVWDEFQQRLAALRAAPERTAEELVLLDRVAEYGAGLMGF